MFEPAQVAREGTGAVVPPACCMLKDAANPLTILAEVRPLIGITFPPDLLPYLPDLLTLSCLPP